MIYLIKLSTINYNSSNWGWKKEKGYPTPPTPFPATQMGKRKFYFAYRIIHRKNQVVIARFIYTPIPLLQSDCNWMWAWQKLNLSRSNTHQLNRSLLFITWLWRSGRQPVRCAATAGVWAWVWITILSWITVPSTVTPAEPRWVIIWVNRSICSSIKCWPPVITCWGCSGSWAILCTMNCQKSVPSNNMRTIREKLPI